jgi:YfiH family protein
MHYLTPSWPAPSCVKAYSSLRMEGHSQPPYDSFNLSAVVSDDADAVAKNRAQLVAELKLSHAPVWMKQVHGIEVVPAHNLPAVFPEADASWTDVPQLPCAVLTADCLPLLLCAPDGAQVAAIHAGWRGLAAGVIEATLDALDTNPDWLVWLGPAIGPTALEVGEEVHRLFLQADSHAASAFQSLGSGKYVADIYTLAKQRLAGYGIDRIYGGEYCTYSDATRFYSYRRDKEKAGRMVSLIWIDNP